MCRRVISRAPGLKLVVETLITSLRPIGNIVLICCAFFIVFGILGVQVNICTLFPFHPLLVEDKPYYFFVFEDFNCKIHILNLSSAVLCAKTSKGCLLFPAVRRH